MKTIDIIQSNILISEFVLPSIEWNDSRKGMIRLYSKPGHTSPHCEAHDLNYDEDWN